MPKNSTADVTKEPYHKMTLTTRLYLSDHPSGEVFAVTSCRESKRIRLSIQKVNELILTSTLSGVGSQ